MELGRIGIWSWAFANMPSHALREIMPEIESLGFRTMWYPEYLSREALTGGAVLLAAGKNCIAVTGIAVIWGRDATTMANGSRTLAEAYPGRFALGIGVSHRPIVTTRGWNYERPYSTMVDYLDAMEKTRYIGPPPAQEPPVILAALGPRMLRLAAKRAWGAHPYFVTPEHTHSARAILGAGTILAPEQAVVLSTDADAAREIARNHASLYLSLPNYRNNLMRLGWCEEDLDHGGSNALIDAIVAWGDLDTIRSRIDSHLEAGADHVGVQVLNGQEQGFPITEWREIAPALTDLL